MIFHLLQLYFVLPIRTLRLKIWHLKGALLKLMMGFLLLLISIIRDDLTKNNQLLIWENWLVIDWNNLNFKFINIIVELSIK